MDKKYLMGNDDGLVRSTNFDVKETYINKRLKKNLLVKCISLSFEFYSDLFNKECRNINFDKIYNDYLAELDDAKSIGLFKTGGVRIKDHINFWCLGRVLKPKLYIESGVFIGSSLHAFINCPGLSKIIAIDPNLKYLKINTQSYQHIELNDRDDFSQIKVKEIPDINLTYFDDHINTASRIIQSHNLGLKYLLFDDSTGIEGVCQRLYPAVPTIPMIMNWELFSLGDKINWVWKNPQINKRAINIFTKKVKHKNKNVSLIIDETFLEQCKLARSYVKKYTKILDLGTFMPQIYPEKMVDTTKYLIELND